MAGIASSGQGAVPSGPRAVASSQSGVREFDFTDADFEAIKGLIYNAVGISLCPIKRNLVYGRLARRLRELKFDSFATYLGFLETQEGAEEIERLVNRLTTNHTHFFREAHHFQHLEQEVLKPAFAAARSRPPRVRIWSAACSTGEEPYSIAMSACSAAGKVQADLRILATDIDTEVLSRAANGIYNDDVVEGLPPPARSFMQEGPNSGEVRICGRARGLVTFKRLNLLEEWPMSGPFDVIFCRNVMIYFDNETKFGILKRMAELLRPGGFLYIGHSETMPTESLPFQLVGRTIYRRVGSG